MAGLPPLQVNQLWNQAPGVVTPAALFCGQSFQPLGLPLSPRSAQAPAVTLPHEEYDADFDMQPILKASKGSDTSLASPRSDTSSFIATTPGASSLDGPAPSTPPRGASFVGITPEVISLDDPAPSTPPKTVSSVATTPGHSSLNGPAPPAPPGHEGPAPSRTQMPNFALWSLGESKKSAKFCLGTAKKGTGLRYRTGEDDILTKIAGAKKEDLVAANVKRARHREKGKLESEWAHWPLGSTPVKKPKAGNTQVNVRKTGSAVCRVISLIACDDGLFGLMEKLYQRPERDEMDRRALGSKHEFYVRLAKAVVDEDWISPDGNPISLPDDHLNDKLAPAGLCESLAAINLVFPAIALRAALPLGEDGVPDFTLLQEQLKQWISDTTSDHLRMRHREDQSGGAGADPVVAPVEREEPHEGDNEGGGGVEGVEEEKGNGNPAEGTEELVNPIHTFEFCQGVFTTLLWDDMMLKKTGGRELSGIAELVIPDDAEGSGSSVPGGTGTRTFAEAKARGGSVAVKKEKMDKGVRKEKLFGDAADLIASLSHNAARSAKDAHVTAEEIADRVLRLAKKLREVAWGVDDDEVIKMYELELEEARDELREAVKSKETSRSKASS